MTGIWSFFMALPPVSSVDPMLPRIDRIKPSIPDVSANTSFAEVLKNTQANQPPVVADAQALKINEVVKTQLKRVAKYGDEMRDILRIALGNDVLSQKDLLILQARAQEISFEL